MGLTGEMSTLLHAICSLHILSALTHGLLVSRRSIWQWNCLLSLEIGVTSRGKGLWCAWHSLPTKMTMEFLKEAIIVIA